MRKVVLALVALMFAGSMVVAQEFSDPGIFDHGGDIAHYNQAYKWIEVVAPMPGQVSFELPTLSLQLNLANIVPNNSFNVSVRVRNHSDRAINVIDQGFTPDPQVQACGFVVSANEPLYVALNGEAWFTYNITVPNESTLAACIAQLEAGGDTYDGFSGYDQPNRTVYVATRLEATGIAPAPDTSEAFGF